MKVFIGLIVVLSAARFCFAADPEMNPCTLVPKEELAKIIGETNCVLSVLDEKMFAFKDEHSSNSR